MKLFKTTIVLTLALLCLSINGKNMEGRDMQANNTSAANSTDFLIDFDYNATENNTIDICNPFRLWGPYYVESDNNTAPQIPAPPLPFYEQEGFGQNLTCENCSDVCVFIEEDIANVSAHASSTCDLGIATSTIDSLLTDAEDMLVYIYMTNQWFYNKPFFSQIANKEWNSLQLLWNRYRVLQQQLSVLTLEMTANLICTNTKQFENELDLLLNFTSLLSASDGAAKIQTSCGIDACQTLSDEDDNLLLVIATMDNNTQLNDTIVNIEKDLIVLNFIADGYDALWTFLDAQYNSTTNNMSLCAAEILTNAWNQTINDSYSDFFTNLTNLLDDAGNNISMGIEYLMNTTYTIPSLLSNASSFQLPDYTLVHHDIISQCSLYLNGEGPAPDLTAQNVFSASQNVNATAAPINATPAATTDNTTATANNTAAASNATVASPATAANTTAATNATATNTTAVGDQAQKVFGETQVVNASSTPAAAKADCDTSGSLRGR